jgi:hypothetical protein
MVFQFRRLRFSFVARDRVHFPAGQPGNVLRGALGTVFRGIVCVPDCPGARTCDRRQSCAYARVFEPAALGPGPSGLADWPRPFVFRARHLDGLTVEPGASFWFDLHLFLLDPEAPEHFARAFREIGRQGVGPGRGRAEMCGVEQLAPSQIALDPPANPPARIRVDFLTPTELKHDGRVVTRPDFGILFARVRDRISTLSALYGAGPLPMDFKAGGERAAQVRTLGCDIQSVRVTRRSSRTGQRHPIGGFTGSAEYEGDLGEFLPYLEAARWTGVGRQTVWGNGEIAITELPPP